MKKAMGRLWKKTIDLPGAQKEERTFLSAESFKLLGRVFADTSSFTQRTERFSIVADVLEREPRSCWPSVLEVAYRSQRGALPTLPLPIEKKELPRKPIRMTDEAFREANEKHRDLLEQVDKVIRGNRQEAVRYEALAELLEEHKDRLARTLMLARASLLIAICAAVSEASEDDEDDEDDEIVICEEQDEDVDEEREEEEEQVFSVADMMERKFRERFEEVFGEDDTLFSTLKERVGDKHWQRFTHVAAMNLSPDQMRIILGLKWFRDFAAPDEVEFTTKEEVEMAALARQFPARLTPHVRKCRQLLIGSRESSVIDVQLRKLRLIVNMDWDHPLPEVSRDAFVRRMNEQLYGQEQLVVRMAELMSLTKYQREPGFQTPIIMEGPFGVGKSTFARAVAAASGRTFAEVNFAGHSDPETLFGSGDVFVNGMYGLCTKRVAELRSDAPVLFIDEPEKALARAGAGSVVNGLLSLAESGQLEDHFMGFPIDLSRSIVILAVNDAGALPAALRNRCQIIRVNDYSKAAKHVIASDYLWKQMQQDLAEPARCPITEDAVRLVVEHGQDATGLRKVRRMLQQLVRYAVDQLEQGVKIGCIDKNVAETVLGLPVNAQVGDDAECGCINGLAVFECRGRVMRIESIVEEAEGGNSLQLFGNACSVLKESARLALEVLRRMQGAEGLRAQVHLQEAGIKKDGPSAGLGMILAMYSALNGMPLSRRIAATGEITLRGSVHPVGGVAEKLRAAEHAGCRWVLIPRDNARDVPADLDPSVTVVPVSSVEEAVAWMKQQNG